MNTNDEIFKLYESVDKYGQISFFRLEPYGKGSRFGTKSAPPDIKPGLHQKAGIYVFDSINRMKNYIQDPNNHDLEKPNNGKLCEKITIEKSKIKYPQIQFDVEVMIAAAVWFQNFLYDYTIKNFEQLKTKNFVTEENSPCTIYMLPFGTPTHPDKKRIRIKAPIGEVSFTLNFFDVEGTNKWPIIEQIIDHLVNIDSNFVNEYNNLLLKYAMAEQGCAYKITDTSIIKNIYYFYADKL